MKPKHKYCDIEGCDTPAVAEVPASINQPGDTSRSLCYPCSEAYNIGAQHARMEAASSASATAKPA